MTDVQKKAGDYLFYYAYAIYLIVTLLSTSFYYQLLAGKPTIVFLAGSLLLLIIREISIDEIPVENILLIITGMFLSILIVKNSPMKTWALFVVFIYAARTIDFKKIAKFTAVLSGALLLIIIVSSYIGVIPNTYDIWSGRPRYYLGFRYALYPATVLFNIMALAIYSKGEKCRWWVFCGLGTANYYIYYMTDSRLCYYTGWLIIAAGVLWKLNRNRRIGFRRIGKALVFTYIAAFILSIWLTWNYVPYGWMKRLNIILGNRLKKGQASLREFGITWLGKKITWSGNGLELNGQKNVLTDNYVDCLYVQILQRYGILFTIIVLILLTVLMYRLYQEEQWILLWVLAVLAVHGIIDDLIFFLYYNTFWLLLSMLFVDGFSTKEYRYSCVDIFSCKNE